MNQQLLEQLRAQARQLTEQEVQQNQLWVEDLHRRHQEWIQTPEGLLEVLADPDVALHPHLSPTFLWRDPELTHEQKMQYYRDYQAYHKGEWE